MIQKPIGQHVRIEEAEQSASGVLEKIEIDECDKPLYFVRYGKGVMVFGDSNIDGTVGVEGLISVIAVTGAIWQEKSDG